MLIADLDYLEETTQAVTGGFIDISTQLNINIEAETNVDATAAVNVDTGAVVSMFRFNNQGIVNSSNKQENKQLVVA